MIYYAQRKSIKNGAAEPINNRFGERADMQRQYHLYCASAATNEADNDYDSIEWGTVEQGVLQREAFNHPPEPEVEDGL